MRHITTRSGTKFENTRFYNIFQIKTYILNIYYKTKIINWIQFFLNYLVIKHVFVCYLSLITFMCANVKLYQRFTFLLQRSVSKYGLACTFINYFKKKNCILLNNHWKTNLITTSSFQTKFLHHLLSNIVPN